MSISLGNEEEIKQYFAKHGDALLKMAGVAGITRWEPVMPESVAPKKIPLGVMNVWFPNETKPVLYYVKIVVYENMEAHRQMGEEIKQIYDVFGIVPEALLMALRPNPGQAADGAH